MKKTATLHLMGLSAGLMFLAAPASKAAILFQENFDSYQPGDLIANSGGAWGLDNANPTTQFLLEDTGWGTGLGVRSVPKSSTNVRARTTVDLTGYTNSTVYFSFWVDVLPVPVSEGGNGSDNGARFVAAGIWSGPQTSGASGVEMVYFGKRSSSAAGWGIFNPGTNTESSISPHGIDGPTQIVLRVDFDANGNEHQRLYVLDVNNIPVNEPLDAAAEFSGYNFPLPADSIVDFRFSSGGNNGGTANPNANWGMWDNFGVFTEWSDLFIVNGAAVPEPGSALLLAGAALGFAARRRLSR